MFFLPSPLVDTVHVDVALFGGMDVVVGVVKCLLGVVFPENIFISSNDLSVVVLFGWCLRVDTYMNLEPSGDVAKALLLFEMYRSHCITPYHRSGLRLKLAATNSHILKLKKRTKSNFHCGCAPLHWGNLQHSPNSMVDWSAGHLYLSLDPLASRFLLMSWRWAVPLSETFQWQQNCPHFLVDVQ